MGLINISRVAGGSASVPTPPAGVDTLFNEAGDWFFKDNSGVVSIIAKNVAQVVGPTGSTGSAGTSGTSGLSGTSGSSGSSGLDGSAGTSGSSGLSGSSGVSGSSGTSGSSGQDGSSGTSGAGGSSGLSGSSGTSGANGSSGTSGADGSSGTSGQTGSSGLAGSSGTSGADGSSGLNGTSGSSGADGSSGLNGTSGINGTDGTAGTSGLTGTSGTSGNTPAQIGASASFGITIDGGGSAITTGVKGFLQIPYAGTITGWTILSDITGSIVIDLFKDSFVNFPPLVGDTICGSEKPTLSSAQSNEDLTLSTWTTAVNPGDIIAFNVDSASTLTRVNLGINITKT